MLEVSLLRVDDGSAPGPDRLSPPTRMRAGDAGADLPASQPTSIDGWQRQLVPTGFAIAIPVGACGLILPRSGLALDHGVTVLNAPGLIDSGYRGELKVLLHNTTAEPVVIERGQRIAQLVIVAVEAVRFIEVDQLPPGPDDRGAAGFGSSG